jgi:hypothetical protein
MKKILIIILFIYSNNILVFSQPNSNIKHEDTLKVDDPYKYILDYDVPESPAFTVLGVNPGTVVRGSASKPIMINLLGQFIFGEKIQPGLALDFSLTAFGITFKNLKTYQKWYNRLLVNTQFSIATIQDKKDTNSLRYGIGVRFNILDGNDPLLNTQLFDSVNILLSNYAKAPTEITDDVVGVKEVKGFSDAYLDVKKKLSKLTSFSLSVGYGLDGLIKGSVIKKDSIINNNHTIWISGQCNLNRFILLGLFQGKYSKSKAPFNLIGIAIKSNRIRLNIGGELIYDFKARKLEGGFNGEVKIVTGLYAIVGVTIVNEEINNEFIPKVKLRSNLKWNMGN